MAKLLLVDDDAGLTEVISAWLASLSHTLEVCYNGRDALDRLQVSQYDVILLDWELPEVSGPQILQELRGWGSTTPVIMLTGRWSLNERIEGLDCGADDYLTKPFSLDELAARIRALLRRGAIVSNVLSSGNLTLDPIKHAVIKDGEPVQLLPREFALLEFLMRHPGDVFSSEALLQRVWRSESEATDEAIRTCIKRLRQKLDRDQEPSVIETIPRIGYRLRVS